LLLPALANAHDHGRFFSPPTFGVPDQPLETWLAGLALQPDLDQHLTALAYLSRLARRGIASTMHLHRARPVDVLLEEAAQVCSAAEVVGIRLAFAVPLQDRNHVAYSCGDSAVPLPAAGPPWRPASVPSAHTLLDAADAVAAAHDSDLVEVQYGPLGPQWASDALLGGVAERSAATGRRVHMHLLESRRQREWADAAHPDGLVRHLDRLGLLSPRLSVAHGVWLRPEEGALLAERGVTVVVNTSSNLRLRSGVAPVGDLLDAGVRCAMGLDGNALDDDDDAFRELRLLALLQAGTGLTPRVSAEQVFRAAVDGAAAVHRGPAAWGLAPRAAADVVVLDARPLARDVRAPLRDDLALLLSRGSSSQVRHVWAGGRHVVRDGAVTGLDEDAVVTELRARAAAGTHDPRHGDLPAIQNGLLQHYGRGMHREERGSPDR
jgi:cytosine/adenosine deaminase-related metal-dependent hydrolase